MTTIYLSLLLLFYCKSIDALNNGLALTPPMGFMTWQRYRCIIDCNQFPDECISEQLIRKIADIMLKEGYLDAGYQYLIIDDCWLEKTRGPAGELQADKQRFPSGIKALSKYVHSKGLKFGIYEDYGNKTCQGYPGVIDHMEQDANLFAEWEVDYVKLDGCYAETRMMDIGYPEFGKYLNRTGRPMVYSCSWPAYQEEKGMTIDYEAMVEHCNLWRNYDDIQDSWSSVTNIMDYFALKQDFWAQYAGPGHWNDPDMLLIGNYGLSYEQSKTQMAVWAILAAPLLLSTDLYAVRPEFKRIIQNKYVIEVNQDPLGIQGKRVYKDKNIEMWVRKVTPVYQNYFSYALAFVNRRDDGSPFNYNATLMDVGMKNPFGYRFTNLYPYDHPNEKPFTMFPKSALNLRINPSGVVFYRAEVLTVSPEKDL